MSILPKNTILGKLEIIEIYEYYDKPLLFACRNAADNLYLVVLEDEEDDIDTWLYVSVSRTRFDYIRSGAIDLYDAFKKAENDFVFKIKTFHNEAEPQIASVSVHELNEEDLPEKEERLELVTQTLPISQVDIAKKAYQANRDILELALHFSNRNRNEAPISELGDIMRHLQGTIISLGHTISPLHNQSKSPSKDLHRQLEMALVETKAGSFKLEMVANEQPNVFGESLIGEVMQELIRVMEVEVNEENLTNIFLDYKTSVPKRYLELLKAISRARVDKTDLKWSSPRSDRGGEVSISSPKVFAVIEVIESMEETETRTYQVTGQLTGTYTERTFEITDKDGKKYSGRIDMQNINVDSFDIIDNATIKERYTVTLREHKIRRAATDEVRTKYYLVDVQKADN